MNQVKSICAVFLIIAMISVTLAADCYMYYSCSDCTARSYCGWCDSAQACWDGDSSGPSNPYQECSADNWNYKSCGGAELRNGVPYLERSVAVGKMNYYTYEVLPSYDLMIKAYTDIGVANPIYTIYASQKGQPTVNNYQWKADSPTNIVNLTLSPSGSPPLSEGTLYIGIYPTNSLPFDVVVYQPPPQ